jgi:hypothetical protein
MAGLDLPDKLLQQLHRHTVLILKFSLATLEKGAKFNNGT